MGRLQRVVTIRRTLLLVIMRVEKTNSRVMMIASRLSQQLDRAVQKVVVIERQNTMKRSYT